MKRPETIRILGIPWRIEVSDAPDGDPEARAHCNSEQCALVLNTSVEGPRAAWHLFWCVLRALDEHVEFVPTDRDPDDYYLHRAHAALFPALRDNAQTVLRWFSKGPAEGDRLRLQGIDWTVKRPRRIPGGGADTIGLSAGDCCTLYVRADLPSARAAETALHELIHAAVHAVDAVGKNEAWVNVMSGMLAQVFFDNPNFLRWLLS